MLKMATLACLGGMFYRLFPPPSHLSPHIASIFSCSAGSADGDWLHSLGIVGFLLAVKYFAVLPETSRTGITC